jgi:hypothetical protein
MKGLSVEDLLHIKEIEFLKSRYCRAIDNKEWDLLPQLFLENARFEGFGGIPSDATVSEFFARISKTLERAITVHHLHHHEISILEETRARGVWAMMDFNEWPEPGVALRSVPEAIGYCGYGFYEESYRRRDGIWRIEFMRLARIRRDPVFRDGRAGKPDPFARRGFISPRPDWLDVA